MHNDSFNGLETPHLCGVFPAHAGIYRINVMARRKNNQENPPKKKNIVNDETKKMIEDVDMNPCYL